VVVARAGNGYTQQILIIVDRFDYSAEEKQKLSVLIRSFARLEQIDAVGGRYRPVVVFAAAVDALKRLLVQQADHAVLAGDLLHYLHG